MKGNNRFFETSWRPALAWSYVVINLFDFAIAPVLYNVLQYYNPGQHLDAYTSVTLQGGGLFHLSMGAVLGIAAHGRTQEKLGGADIKIPTAPAPVHTPAPTPVSNQAYGFSQPAAVHPVETGKFGKVIPPAEDPVV